MNNCFIAVVRVVVWVSVLVLYCYGELWRKNVFLTDLIDFVELSTVDVQPALLGISDTVVVLLLTTVGIFVLIVIVKLVVRVLVLVVYC